MSRSPTETVGPAALQDYFAAWRAYRQLVHEGNSFSGRERNCVFLNTGAERFGNISAVSGLDFKDDGRAIGLTDWDHDGDVDLWIVSRTDPQARFMRNDTPTDARWLAVRLEGTASNRDAVGARATLYLQGQSDKPILRTVAAGGGYLSQASRWLHFGLGADGQVDRLEIRWPNGDMQTFTDIPASAHYTIREGADTAQRWTPPTREIDLAPAHVDHLPTPGSAHIRLAERAPMPDVAFESLEGEKRSLTDYRGQPVLINLWATWCQPCIVELKGLAAARERIDAAGLRIVAVSVDGLGDDRGASVEQINSKLDDLRFPFDRARATTTTVDVLQTVRNSLFDWFRPFPVPTSFLISARGELIAIYQGPVEADVLLDDLTLADLDADALRQAAVPFEGRWLSPPRQVLASHVASVLSQAGHLDLAADMLTSAEPPAGAEAHFAEAYQGLGARYFHADRLEAARDAYAASLNYHAANPRVWTDLGILEGRLGNVAGAIEAFDKALAVNADFTDAHYNLGVARLLQRDLAAAAACFEKTIALAPSRVDAHMQLAAVLLESDQPAAAIAPARRACDLTDHTSAAPLRLLAAALAAAGQTGEAATTAARALDLAERADDQDLAASIRAELATYQAAP